MEAVDRRLFRGKRRVKKDADEELAGPIKIIPAYKKSNNILTKSKRRI